MAGIARNAWYWYPGGQSLARQVTIVTLGLGTNSEFHAIRHQATGKMTSGGWQRQQIKLAEGGDKLYPESARDLAIKISKNLHYTSPYSTNLKVRTCKTDWKAWEPHTRPMLTGKMITQYLTCLQEWMRAMLRWLLIELHPMPLDITHILCLNKYTRTNENTHKCKQMMHSHQKAPDEEPRRTKRSRTTAELIQITKLGSSLQTHLDSRRLLILVSCQIHT